MKKLDFNDKEIGYNQFNSREELMLKALIYIIFFLLCEIVPAQTSPGDLSKAHAFLEGAANCTQCHETGRFVFDSKCLNCHTEIRNLISSGKGYHSNSEVRGKNCWDCHSEHHGRNFKVVNFYEELFKHDKTQFPLTGKHEEIKCSSCHQSKFISDNKIKKRTKTYLGLDAKCQSCHQDYHQNTLSASCGFCHDTESFKPAPKFDHNNALFKLTGAHQTTECISCHPVSQRNGREFQKFKSDAFPNCSSCHRDVHENKFGNQCQSCHTTNSFHEINRASFNHDKTNFPLIGKHKNVSCNSCHSTSITASLKHENCNDCHSDFHKGDLQSGEINKDCSDCHTVNRFQPSTFTIVDHEKTQFKLTGSHLAVSCRNCHYKNNKWQFKLNDRSCISCHGNIHGDELSSKNISEGNCTNCHQTNSWDAVSFNHSETDFPLLGKHKNITCKNCHNNKQENVTVEFRFVSINNNCENCHMDIHNGQFRHEEINDCLSCHSFENWEPGSFDHERTKFPLSGAHKNISCSSCHKETERNGFKFIRYKLEYFQCAACHS